MQTKMKIYIVTVDVAGGGGVAGAFMTLEGAISMADDLANSVIATGLFPDVINMKYSKPPTVGPRLLRLYQFSDELRPRRHPAIKVWTMECLP